MRVRWLSKQKRVQVSLLDLPDELLLQIIEELNQIDLYTLSVQCKRLQRMCLPAYLLHLGVTTPLIFPIDHLAILPAQLYSPGLSLPFFAKTVRRFSCDIGNIDNWHGIHVTSPLHRLFGIVINLKGLEDLELDFNSWLFLSIKKDAMAQACIHLLDVVSERCTRLALSHASRYGCSSWHEKLLRKEAVKWRSRPPLEGPLTALRGRLSLGIPRSRSSHIPDTSRNLKTLILKSDTCLLPPFTGWAFKVMNTAPLTRLELIDIHLREQAAFIFGTLTIPTLQQLRIIVCVFGMDFDPVAEFLSRHNTITTFEFISPFNYVHPLPITTLPALVSLASNPHGIGRLLTPTGAFPILSHIRVVIQLSPTSAFVFNTVEASLGPIARRLTTANVRLCLDILSASHTHNWINGDSLRNNLRYYPVLRMVKEIAITFYPTNILALFFIPPWLAQFPLLEHVELTRITINVTSQINVSFLRSIAEKCPGIRTVTIGDDTRDMPAWLSSDS